MLALPQRSQEIIMATVDVKAESAPDNPVRINTDEFEKAFIDMELAIALIWQSALIVCAKMPAMP